MNILQNGLYGILTENGKENILLLVAFIFVSAIASYLFGSLNSAIIVSKALYKEDVRSHGSGNAGLTNMLRTYGGKAAAFTLIGDMLKTAISILLTALLLGFSYKNGISLNGYCYLSGLCAVLGHVFPIYYGFKGGKGVLVTATMALIITPISFVALILIFSIILLITGFVSLGSIVVAGLYPITVCLYIPLVCMEAIPLFTIISTVFLGLFVIWCHRSNIERLINKNEKRISIGKKEQK